MFFHGGEQQDHLTTCPPPKDQTDAVSCRLLRSRRVGSRERRQRQGSLRARAEEALTARRALRLRDPARSTYGGRRRLTPRPARSGRLDPAAGELALSRLVSA